MDMKSSRINENQTLLLKREVELTYVRSQGPGGQHVNKTNSAVQLRWNLWSSRAFSAEEKQRISHKLVSYLTNDGDLLLKTGSFREQDKNVKACFVRFIELLDQGLFVAKKRKATRPTKGSKERRLSEKKRMGERKKMRQEKI